jgi:hypothetical protein
MAVMIGLISFLLRAEIFLALPGNRHFRVVNHAHEGTCLWPKGGGGMARPVATPSLRHCLHTIGTYAYALTTEPSDYRLITTSTCVRSVVRCILLSRVRPGALGYCKSFKKLIKITIKVGLPLPC